MHTSIDKLFHDSEVLDTQSSVCEGIPGRPGSARVQSGSPSNTGGDTVRTSSPQTQQNQNRPTKSASPRQSVTTPSRNEKSPTSSEELRNSSELYKEYQKQRQKLQEKLEEQEKQRQVYQQELQELEKRSLNIDDNRLIESGVMLSQNNTEQTNYSNRDSNCNRKGGLGLGLVCRGSLWSFKRNCECCQLCLN